MMSKLENLSESDIRTYLTSGTDLIAFSYEISRDEDIRRIIDRRRNIMEAFKNVGTGELRELSLETLEFLKRRLGKEIKPYLSSHENLNKGFSLYGGFQGSANSAGLVTKLDTSLGYNFNRHFGMDIGVPYYFVRPSATTSSTTGTGFTKIFFIILIIF